MAGLTYWFNRRMEAMKTSYQRTLKRYDLLNVERYKQFERFDDALVDVQLRMFDTYVSFRKPTPSEGAVELAAFKKATSNLAIAKIKAEKYFDDSFNKEFEQLVGEVQNVLMHADDLTSGNLNEAQRNETQGEMNTTMNLAKSKVLKFRLLMAERIQHDLG
jgi:hypothetical protein